MRMGHHNQWYLHGDTPTSISEKAEADTKIYKTENQTLGIPGKPQLAY